MSGNKSSKQHLWIDDKGGNVRVETGRSNEYVSKNVFYNGMPVGSISRNNSLHKTKEELREERREIRARTKSYHGEERHVFLREGDLEDLGDLEGIEDRYYVSIIGKCKPIFYSDKTKAATYAAREITDKIIVLRRNEKTKTVSSLDAI